MVLLISGKKIIIETFLIKKWQPKTKKSWIDIEFGDLFWFLPSNTNLFCLLHYNVANKSFVLISFHSSGKMIHLIKWKKTNNSALSKHEIYIHSYIIWMFIQQHIIEIWKVIKSHFVSHYSSFFANEWLFMVLLIMLCSEVS